MKKLVGAAIVGGWLLIGSLVWAAETYTLGFIPLVGWSHYKVAEVKGFWEKQGVTVTLIDYINPIDTSHGVVQRYFDLTPLPMAVMGLYRDAGVTDSVYLGTLNIADYTKYVVIKKDLVNKSLKGQTVGTFLIDQANSFLLSTYLKSVGTSLLDIRQVEMFADDLEANFIHDRLQVVLALDRKNRFYEQANGVVAISTHDFYEPHGLMALREDPLNTIPHEDLKKIMRGCIEAILWQQDPANWEEFKAILKQYFPLGASDDLTDEQYRIHLTDGKRVDPQMLLEHNQQRLQEYFSEFKDFCATPEAKGVMSDAVLKDFTYDSVIKNQALIEVLQEYVE